jgi:hypothetical protein
VVLLRDTRSIRFQSFPEARRAGGFRRLPKRRTAEPLKARLVTIALRSSRPSLAGKSVGLKRCPEQ